MMMMMMMVMMAMMMMMVMAMTIMNDDNAGAPRLGRPGELQHPGGEDHQAQRALGGNGKIMVLIK